MSTLNEVKLFGVDTETTGTQIGKDRICQVACIEAVDLCTDNFHYRTVMTEYCDPGIPMPQGAYDVHKIGPEKYKGTSSDKARLILLGGELVRHGGPDEIILFGHNSSGFDLPLIQSIDPGGIWHEYYAIDTMKLAYHFLNCNQQRRARLASDEAQLQEGEMGLVQWYLGEEAQDAHDAEADCVMTAAVLEKFISDPLNPFGTDLLTMAQFCDEPRPFRRMPFGKHAGKVVDPQFRRGSVPKSYFQFFRDKVPDMSPDLQATVDWVLGAPE